MCLQKTFFFFQNTWQRKKLLVASHFSFFTVFSTDLENFLPLSSNLKIVICKLFYFGRVKSLLFGKGLKRRTLFKPVCLCLQVSLQCSYLPLYSRSTGILKERLRFYSIFLIFFFFSNSFF